MFYNIIICAILISTIKAFSITTTKTSSFSILKNTIANLKMSTFYDIVEKDSKGQDFAFSNFRGKVVYGVNVASKCGYTASGYELIKKLTALKGQGVEVALFPCNQFGKQEPGTETEIEQFCALKGAQGANLFAKGDVNGPNTRPTYAYVRYHVFNN